MEIDNYNPKPNLLQRVQECKNNLNDTLRYWSLVEKVERRDKDAVKEAIEILNEVEELLK